MSYDEPHCRDCAHLIAPSPCPVDVGERCSNDQACSRFEKYVPYVRQCDHGLAKSPATKPVTQDPTPADRIAVSKE